MRLLLLHPEVSAVECRSCMAWLHGKDWKPVMKAGRKVPRHGKPPCGQCPKIGPGVEPRPENAAELDDRGRQAYWHYLECRAVEFNVPDVADPLVRHNAAVFRSVEDEVARVREDLRNQVLMTAALARGGKK